METGFLLLALATGLAGCNGHRVTGTSPSASTPQPLPPTGDSSYSVADVTLSGVVYEMTPNGRVPIEGVSVSNGEGGLAVTDADGFYSIRPVWVCPCSSQPWIDGGTTLLWVQKDGYGDPALQPVSVFTRGIPNPGPGWRDVRIDGDTRFDTELLGR